VTLGTIKVLNLVVFFHWSSINSNWGVSFHSILMTITQDKIHYKTKVSHKHMIVIYHWNTPLPKVWKGLDGYTLHLMPPSDLSTLKEFHPKPLWNLTKRDTLDFLYHLDVWLSYNNPRYHHLSIWIPWLRFLNSLGSWIPWLGYQEFRSLTWTLK
jgi:hypothetical protein